MEFEEASAPVRYALDDHDSDEELEACQALNNLTVKLDISFDSSPSTLLISVDQPGKIYLESLPNTQAIGNIYRQTSTQQKESKATVFQQNDMVLIAFDTIVPEEAGEYTRVIMQQLKAAQVIVLDSFRAVGYVSQVWGEDLVPPFLRVLQTSAAKKTELTPFEAPNMIQGLSAAIMSYCEIHQVPCYDLLSFQESLYGQLLVTTEILTAYDMGFKVLGYPLRFDQQKMQTILSQQGQQSNNHRLYL